MKEISGIVKFDKPAGWTSFDVVNKTRGTLNRGSGAKIKVGHSGTLDPFATGLLLIGYGNCTKRLGDLTNKQKTYEGVLKFGAISDTGDIDGQIKEEKTPRQPTKAEVTGALQSFIGKSHQIPPAYSAVKVDGQRSYRLARSGKTIKHDPREIEIFELAIIKYKYPVLSFKTTVSSGTYIRALAEDIAKKLRTTAYLTELRRTAIGSFGLDGCLTPSAGYQEILEASQRC